MNIDAPIRLLGYASGYLAWPNENDLTTDVRYIRGLANLFSELTTAEERVYREHFSDEILSTCRWLPGVESESGAYIKVSADDPSITPDHRLNFVRLMLLPTAVENLTKTFGLTINQHDIDTLEMHLLHERFSLADALLKYSEKIHHA